MATVQPGKTARGRSSELGSANTHAPPKAGGSKRPKHKGTPGKGVRRGLGTASDGSQSNGEDNTADEADTEEEDEPRKIAPSGGFVMGRGKRPAICVEPAEQDDEENRGTGLDQESLLTTPSKKRSFSNSNASIFAAFDEGADSDDAKDKTGLYPRKKLARKLSNNGNGLLAYEGVRKDSTASVDVPPVVPENAIDSSDDDEIYKALDEIDESDNDEYIDENLEEKALRKALSITSDDESENGDGPDVSMLLGTNYEGDLLAMDNDQLLGLSSDHWGDMGEIAPVQSNNSTRRVRFDDHVHAVSDVDSDTSSEDLNNFFPDLFHRDNQLLASFHHGEDPDHIGYFDGSTASDSEKSYWDFGDEKEKASDWSDHDVHTESDSDPEAGSSGYETDEGDTTDEDLPPPPTIHKPSRVHRDSSSSAGSATPKSFPCSNKMPPPKSTSKRKGPIKGFFTLDPKRAVAIVDSSGKRMVLMPARLPGKDGQLWPGSTASSTANNSPRSSFQLLNGDESDFSDSNNHSFADIMLSGIYGAAGGLNYPVGPPEAFYPFVGIDVDGTVMDDDDDFDDDDDMEDRLDVHDFIDFGDGDSDEVEDADLPTAADTPTKAHAGCTPAKPSDLSAAHEMSQKMLQHFDRGNVTSFRRNQNRYRDVARLPDDPALRASASRPVRTGASADAIITPMRKRKSSHAAVPRASPLARKSGPIAGSFTARRH